MSKRKQEIYNDEHLLKMHQDFKKTRSFDRLGMAAFVLALLLFVLFFTGCATVNEEPAEDPRITALRAEKEVLQMELKIMEDRRHVLFICKQVTPHENWDECYETAGLER